MFKKFRGFSETGKFKRGLDMVENAKEISDVIAEKSYKDGDKTCLNCASALNIADRFGVSPSVVGSICNEKNIRIRHCQLGCFP